MVSKIYIATDSSPVDMQSYELCCDMIDLVIDVSCIYGYVVVRPCTRVCLGRGVSVVDMLIYSTLCNIDINTTHVQVYEDVIYSLWRNKVSIVCFYAGKRRT